MTDSLFFDSDCISAFLWVREQNLLTLLYPGKIIIPKAAYDELSYPTTPQLKERIDQLLQSGAANLATINLGTYEFDLYRKLTTSPDQGRKIELRHITTGDILIEALEKGHISEAEGNTIWASMLAKRRKLGANSFTEYLTKNR